MGADPATLERLKSHVNRQRLVETARRLIEVPSPTGEAGAVSDRLAEILAADGFTVERPAGGYPASPAVVGPARERPAGPDAPVQRPSRHGPPAVRAARGRGRPAHRQRCLGHEGRASPRPSRRSGRFATPAALAAGSVLLTAHDLHEAPWGDGRQLDQLIRDGHARRCRPAPRAAARRAADRRPRLGDLEGRHSPRRPAGPRGHATARRAERDRRRRRAGRAARPARPELAATSAPDLRRGQRLHRPDPRRRDLSTSTRRRPGSKGPGAGCRGPIPPSRRARLPRRLDRLAADTRTTMTCDWMLIRDAFALDPADPLGRVVSGLLSSDLGLAAAHRAQAVRRRRQQLLGPGGRAGDHPRPPRRRTAHRLGMGRDRRPGPRRWLYAAIAVTYCRAECLNRRTQNRDRHEPPPCPT